MTEEVPIESRDYWFKIVEFLQQNWALVGPRERGGYRVLHLGYFGRLRSDCFLIR
jgi:hypothetical protein